MASDGSERTVDEKGRVTLPKRIREALGIEAGSNVRIERRGDEVVLTPRISREEFVETMTGCVTEETAAADAPEIDPLELKGIWTGDLPEQ